MIFLPSKCFLDHFRKKYGSCKYGQVTSLYLRKNASLCLRKSELTELLLWQQNYHSLTLQPKQHTLSQSGSAQPCLG